MPRFKLILEYAGSRYRGWQAQTGERTIQGELHRVLRALGGEGVEAPYGSGRTDTGVHALGQVAHVDLETELPPEAVRDRLNAGLPPDIHILSVEVAAPRFHARHHAEARSYLYQISRRRTAFAKPFVWWVKEPLDAARMARAGESFAGRHDFRNFAKGKIKGSTVVVVEAVEVGEVGDLILIRVTGSHFLWQMVRRLVGVLVEVGRGGLEPEAIPALFGDPTDLPGRLAASPSGLFLERVFYPGDPRPHPLAPALGRL